MFIRPHEGLFGLREWIEQGVAFQVGHHRRSHFCAKLGLCCKRAVLVTAQPAAHTEHVGAPPPTSVGGEFAEGSAQRRGQNQLTNTCLVPNGPLACRMSLPRRWPSGRLPPTAPMWACQVRGSRMHAHALYCLLPATRLPGAHPQALLPTPPHWHGPTRLAWPSSFPTPRPLIPSPHPHPCNLSCSATPCCAGMPMLPPMMDADGMPIATPFPMMPFPGELHWLACRAGDRSCWLWAVVQPTARPAALSCCSARTGRGWCEPEHNQHTEPTCQQCLLLPPSFLAPQACPLCQACPCCHTRWPCRRLLPSWQVLPRRAGRTAGMA